MQNVHFPGFEILKKLGQGGMGAVYKVREIQTARIFAIKTILSTKKDPRSYQRFLREAQAYAAVQHPNIVRIYRIEPNHDSPFMVMQYVDGLPLHHHMKNKLSFDQKLFLFEEIVKAVHVLHKHNIIHRDLKPANIMIDTSGKPYIMDFGLVKAIDNKNKDLTKKGDILGSPKYMSPEQIGGYKLDMRSDIYALGVCFYEMLTGKQLVEGDSVVSIMFEISHGTITYPRKIDKNIPAALEAICVKCLEKQTKNRYANLQSLINDINRYQNGEKTKAKEVNLWYNLNKTIERHATELVIACIFLLCIFGIWASWSQQRQVLLQHLRDLSKKEAMQTLDQERQKYAEKDIAIQVRYLHSLGNYTQALELLQNAKKNYSLQILEAKTYHKMHEYQQALKIFESIDQNSIQNPEIKEYVNLQIHHAKMVIKKDFLQMEKFCRNAKHKTIQADAHYYLAQNYLIYFEQHFYNLALNNQQGFANVDQAIIHFVKAKKICQQVQYKNDWDQDVDLRIAQCLLYKAQLQNQSHLAQKAENYILENKHNDYDSHRQVHFHSTKALYHQVNGEIQLKNPTQQHEAIKNLQQAIRQYTLAIEIDSSHSQLYLQRAHCYRLSQKYSLSENDYIQVLSAEPQNFSAAYTLVNSLFEETPIESKFPTLQLLRKIAYTALQLSHNDLFAKQKTQLFKSSALKTQPYNAKQVQNFIEKLEKFENIKNPSERLKLQNLVINGLECLEKFEQVYNDLQKKCDTLAHDTALYKTLTKAQTKVAIRGHIRMLINIYLKKNQQLNQVQNIKFTTETLIEIAKGAISYKQQDHIAIIKFIVFKALVDIGSPHTASFMKQTIDNAHANRQNLDQSQAESLALCMALFYNNYWPHEFSDGLKTYQYKIQKDISLLSSALKKSSEIARCFTLANLPIEYKSILIDTLQNGTVKEKLCASKQLWLHGHFEGGNFLANFAATAQEESLQAFAYETLWEIYTLGVGKTSSHRKQEMKKFCQKIAKNLITALQQCKSQQLKHTLLANLAVTNLSKYDNLIIQHINLPTTEPHVRLRIISKLGHRKDISIITKIVKNNSIPLFFRLIAVVGAIDNKKANVTQMISILSFLQKSPDQKIRNLLTIYSISYNDFFKRDVYSYLASKEQQKQLVALVALYGKKIEKQHLSKLKPLIASSSKKLQYYAAMNLGVQLATHVTNRSRCIQQVCGKNIDNQNVREGIIVGYQWLFYQPLYEKQITSRLLIKDDLKNFHENYAHQSKFYAALEVTSPQEMQQKWRYIYKWRNNLSPEIEQQVIFWDGLLQKKTNQYKNALATFKRLENNFQKNYWLAKTHYDFGKLKESHQKLAECLKISPWDMSSQRLQFLLSIKAEAHNINLNTDPMSPSLLFSPPQYRYNIARSAKTSSRNTKNPKRKKILAKQMHVTLKNLPIMNFFGLAARNRALVYLQQPQLNGKQNDPVLTKHYRQLARDYLLYKNQFFHINFHILKVAKLDNLFNESQKAQFMK